MTEPEIVSAAPYRSLSQRLADGCMPLEEAVQCAIALAESLRKLHDAGVVHGSVSPQCIAMKAGGAELMPATPNSGPTSYTAPEVFLGHAAAPPADVFSLGLVLHEMLAERAPDLPLAPSAGPAIDRLITLCLAREPGARPRVRRVLTELRLILFVVRSPQMKAAWQRHSQPSITGALSGAPRGRSAVNPFARWRAWGTGKARARYALIGAALLSGFSGFGFVAGYAGMAGRVSDYNALRQETDTLRGRYQILEGVLNRNDAQMASLKLYAREVSMAYGINRGIGRISNPPVARPLTPTMAESVDEYNILRTANHFRVPIQRSGVSQTANASPSVWPVDGGRLLGGFGDRIDPFSGEGAFHTGVDISGTIGTPVRATADGTVVYAQWQSGYGKVVMVDHGGDVETLYAHLSRYFVNVGETVTRGQYVGAIGATGKATAPHLHYEVRLGGAAVNPYVYHLAKSSTYLQAWRDDALF